MYARLGVCAFECICIWIYARLDLYALDVCTFDVCVFGCMRVWMYARHGLDVCAFGCMRV